MFDFFFSRVGWNDTVENQRVCVIKTFPLWVAKQLFFHSEPVFFFGSRNTRGSYFFLGASYILGLWPIDGFRHHRRYLVPSLADESILPIEPTNWGERSNVRWKAKTWIRRGLAESSDCVFDLIQIRIHCKTAVTCCFRNLKTLNSDAQASHIYTRK